MFDNNKKKYKSRNLPPLMQPEKNLESLGLSSQETKVYLATLSLGLSKASQVAQKTGIARGGVYYTLKLLKGKGFISEVIKSGVQYYSATSPQRIAVMVDEEHELKKETALELMKNLQSIHNSALDAPKIEVYEGYDGFKTIFHKLLERENELFRCYLSPAILEYLPHFHEQFRKKRSGKKITIRTITQKTPVLEKIKELDDAELRETRFTDKLLEEVDLLHYILNDAIVVIRANSNEQLATYIEDRMLAQLHKNIFDSEWEKLA